MKKSKRQQKTFKYRSGLEESVCSDLQKRDVNFSYESRVISFLKPSKVQKYTPDVILDNEIIIEIKGHFKREDRQKHLFIKQQYPNLDIRFLFGNARNKIYKGSKTTYADWCIKNNFKYCEKRIPESWTKNGRT